MVIKDNNLHIKGNNLLIIVMVNNILFIKFHYNFLFLKYLYIFLMKFQEAISHYENDHELLNSIYDAVAPDGLQLP